MTTLWHTRTSLDGFVAGPDAIEWAFGHTDRRSPRADEAMPRTGAGSPLESASATIPTRHSAVAQCVSPFRAVGGATFHGDKQTLL